MKQGSLIYPECMTDDLKGIGHWGYGDYCLYLKPDSDFEYAIDLIKQSYEDKCKKA